MAEKNSPTNSQSYKLVFLRSEDLKELRSFDLSGTSIYVLISTACLLIGGILWLAIAYTPLKQLVPGYGKIEANQQFMQLVTSIDDLEKEIDGRQTYMNAFQTMVTSGVEETPDIKINDFGESYKSAKFRDQPNSKESLFSRSSNKAQIPTVNDKKNIYSNISSNLLLSPVEGIISSPFDPTIKHFGVDILAPANTSIQAIMDGYVFSSGWDIETGYTLGIQHDGNILSFYKHNSQLLKEKGTFVSAGEAVAIIGNTGTLSTGPHLHFELWHNGQPLNPVNYLNLKK